MLVRLRDCVQVCCRYPDDDAQCTMRIFYREQRVDDSTSVLEPRIRARHQTKHKTEGNTKSQVYVTLCLYTIGSWETHKKSVTTKKLQCMTPSCRLASEPHQIMVRTRGRCARELSDAPGHSTHCWTCRPVYRDTNSVSLLLVVKAANSFTFKLYCTKQEVSRVSAFHLGNLSG